jgi:hypothetical protein
MGQKSNQSLPVLLKTKIDKFRHEWPKRLIPLRRLLSPHRVLPDFLIIGAQKAGTTSLYDYLCQHPQIQPALMKEPRYFSRWLDKGEGWYRAYFPLRIQMESAQRKYLTGEASPDYILHPKAAEAAYQLVPNAKILILLRNPVNRAFSQYQHNTKKNRLVPSFEEAIQLELEMMQTLDLMRLSSKDYQHTVQQLYLSRGLYAEQIERWTACYPEEQIMIIQSEVFFRQPQEVLEQVLQFLGLDTGVAGTIDYSPRRKGKYRSTLEPSLRAKLNDYFHPHNERLYALLGKHFDWE